MDSFSSQTNHPVLEPGQILLLTGGARSGKSSYAEKIAAGFPKVLYLATAQALDEEMEARIEAHRRRRPESWETCEEPLDLGRSLEARGASDFDVVLVDCITLWISNWMEAGASDTALFEQLSRFINVVERLPARVILVTNEVGNGVVPVSAGGRRFRDLAGWTNQRLAGAAHHVVCLISGIPVQIKGGSNPR